MSDVADKHQRCTQMYVRRPYGVGLLVGSGDATGPHLYETTPSGNYYEYVAMAIGARAQSAKTYLEKHVSEFSGASNGGRPRWTTTLAGRQREKVGGEG